MKKIKKGKKFVYSFRLKNIENNLLITIPICTEKRIENEKEALEEFLVLLEVIFIVGSLTEIEADVRNIDKEIWKMMNQVFYKIRGAIDEISYEELEKILTSYKVGN